jgi:hypothetical protein
MELGNIAITGEARSPRDNVVPDAGPIRYAVDCEYLNEEADPFNVGMAMRKKFAVLITVLAPLALLVLAVLRGWASRELILERNGLPLADFVGDAVAGGGPSAVPTSTDHDGKLDLGNLPGGTYMLRVTLRDRAGTTVNATITLPTGGSRTIDLRAGRTICTTKRTYAEFGLFRLTGHEVQVVDYGDGRGGITDIGRRGKIDGNRKQRTDESH